MSEAADALDGMDLISRIATATEDPTAEVTRFYRRFGFESFLCLRMPRQRERLRPYTLLDRWPKEFWSEYDARAYYRDDPVADHTFSTAKPFFWSDVPVDHERLPRADLVMDSAASVGLREGFCVPIRNRHGFQAAFTMAGPQIDVSPRLLSTVHVLALATFEALDRRSEGEALERPLSPRERELLSQLGCGRTLAQSADRLGIAQTSAATLLLRAREKLGTLNTAHTVVEALRFRQITL